VMSIPPKVHSSRNNPYRILKREQSGNPRTGPWEKISMMMSRNIFTAMTPVMSALPKVHRQRNDP